MKLVDWRSDTNPILDRDAVHVWAVPLAVPQDEVERLRALLSADEVARADRFKFDKHRRRFTVGRGTLREIIGRYLGFHPAKAMIDVADHGKPYINAFYQGDEFIFNVTHSHELALIAFTRGRLLGIDVELRRDVDDLLNIAHQFFSDAESEALVALSAEQQPIAFLDCWTRKEAYIKAIGDGLTYPLADFDVTLAPNEPARLLRVKGEPNAPSLWTMQAFEPEPHYVAALAVRGNVTISYFKTNPNL